MPVTIYGASDDLIEVEGDIREEFSPYQEHGEESRKYLAFSNGTVISILFSSDGVWRITPVRGSAAITQADGDDEDNYSDVAEIEGDINWVVLGSDFAKR